MSAEERPELPLPDYDHLPLSALRHRVRTLDAEQVRRLIAFEEEHGQRLPVLELLRWRLDALEAGAEPSSGDPRGEQPESASGPSRDAPTETVARSPSTDPSPHGVPSQPAKPKGDHRSPGRL